MISLKTLHRGNAKGAAHYYADQKDDYYSQDGTAAQWQGKAAAALGLEGNVDPETFLRALRGDFGSEVELSNSVRMDSRARAGVDVTFAPPKSVSIQALVGKDADVLSAHDKAVTHALEYLEAELLRARRTEHGATMTERTGNAAIAKWRHETSRPTTGAYSDPQLHTHCIVLNITRRADGTWTAISNEEIFRTVQLLDSVYQAKLAELLVEKGFELRHEGKSFELAHISREQIEALSKRTMGINDELALMGQTRATASRELKQAVALKTRHDKVPDISREDLQRDWLRQAKELGLALSREESRHQRAAEHRITPSAPHGQAAAAMADQAVRWAVKHLTERESVMDEKALVKTALDHARGSGVKLGDVKSAIARALRRGHLIEGTPLYRLARDRSLEPMSRAAWVQRLTAAGATPRAAERQVRRAIARSELVPSGSRYTTQVAREREKRILQIEREGRGKATPVLSQVQAQAALTGRSLKPGQLSAGELILSTSNRVVGVQGLAGTGKSHMLDQVRSVAEASGYTVRAVASYGMQIRALRELGVEARTIASVLEARNDDRFSLDEKTILVVDEAGVVPTRLMEKLLQRAETAGARVVLLGDTEQTKAIEAGRPFHQLQEAGMQTAHMGDIMRQKSPLLKEAVELAASGRADQALDVLATKLQSVRTEPDNERRYNTIADEYVALSEDERGETLILTGTNDSRNALNEAVHRKLGLEGQGFDFTLLSRRDTTQAERREAKYYVAGDIVQPERNYKASGLQQGELYRVLEPAQDNPKKLLVEHISTGERLSFNPSRTTKLSVYQPVSAELSAGDWVRVTRNDAARDLVNGARYKVLAVTPTTVTIGDATRKVTLDATRAPLHLDRAYATTSHGAQGLTADRVLINAESFSRTTKRDVFYVAVSRARHRAEIFTDSLDRLPDAVQRREEKTAALDIGLAAAPSPQHRRAGRELQAGT